LRDNFYYRYTFCFKHVLTFHIILKCFKKVHVIMLRKLNKKNYIQLKVYKLITLLNTLNKALKLIITIKLNYLIKFNALLLKE